ncbi:MAG: hypothetical protein R3B06_20170 [Kofleriaceae bacterium]
MTAPVASRCARLDQLEAAIVRRTPVELTLVDGSVIRGTPVAMATRAGDDWVTLTDGAVVGVSAIVAVSGVG